MSRMLREMLNAADARSGSSWQPAVDVYQSGNAWLIKADLAGVDPDNIAIRLAGRRVTISGARVDGPCETDQRCYLMEISYNRFERSIELPCAVDGARVTTDYRNGLLLIHLSLESAV